MKKKALKITGIVLCVIFGLIAVLGIVVGILNGVASKIDDDTIPSAELSYWMSYIKDETLIKDIVIPGSHDSGTYTTAWVAETQQRTIKEQLECGTRYFDLREGLKGGKLRMIHGPVYGVDFEPVMEDIKSFLENNPTEFLILDFQHFNDNCENEVIEVIEDKLKDKLVVNDTELSEIDFINTLKLQDVRGKAIIYWGVEDENRDKNYVFSRNDDEGNRTGSTLHSFYYASYNKKSSEKYISTALDFYIDLYKKTEGGLFVLQGQLTDGILVVGPKYREYTHNENMNEYISSLKTSENLKYINIILRDFITPSKNELIIELNSSKNLFKS